MKKKFIFLIIYMLIMAGSAMALTVADPGFEDANGAGQIPPYVYTSWGLGGWTSDHPTGGAWEFGTGYYVWTPATNHGGSNHVELNGDYIYQTISGATTGASYELSLFATSFSATNRVFAYINSVDLGFQYITGLTQYSQSRPFGDEWAEMVWIFIAPATSFELKFWGDGDAIIDDVSVTALSTTNVIISETLGSTEVDEAGGSDSYDMVLQSSPANDVQVTVTPGDSQIDIGSGPGVARVLTFTADPGGNWDSPQTINITADDDAVHEPDDDPHTTVITHTSQSVDNDYDDIPINSVSVAVYDNELGCGDWGYLEADTNNDCYVDILDLLEIARKWMLP